MIQRAYFGTIVSAPASASSHMWVVVAIPRTFCVSGAGLAKGVENAEQ